jgi:lysophospholipase L1-like esterase
VVRRTFDKDGKLDSNLAPYAEAAQAVAQEMNVPFVNLPAASASATTTGSALRRAGLQPQADDRTHFNAKAPRRSPT